MWHWQPKNVHKQSALWVQLVTISCTLHLCILFLLLYVYTDGSRELKFTIDSRLLNQDLSVLLMESYFQPHGKKNYVKNGGSGVSSVVTKNRHDNAKKGQVTQAKNRVTGKAETSKNTKNSIKARSKHTIQIPKAQKLDRHNAPAASIQKTATETSVIATEKQPVSKKKKKNKKQAFSNKKISKKLKVKKIIEKKIKKNIKLLEQNKSRTPIAAKQVEAPQAVIPENSPLQSQLLPQSMLSENSMSSQPGHTIDAQQALASGQSDGFVLDGTIMDSQKYDIESLMQHETLNQEVARCWKRPIGMKDSCSCTMKIFIFSDGSIGNIETIESSGILIYDVAARAALNDLQLPQWAHNKYLIITFK